MDTASCDRIAAALIMAAALELVACIIVAQHLYPGYSLNNNYISDLGVGNTASLFNTGVAGFGIMLAVSSLFLYLSGRHLRALGFLIAGIGGFGVGAFPESTGLPHVISATVVFGSVAVMALLYMKVFKGPIRYYTWASGLLGIGILALFILGLVAGVHLNIGLGKGGFEEILFYNELLWAFVTGTLMMLKRI
ncbi:MAG: DUF998 domain-containing protein [Candidatus Micrarchaeota archaeon]|nr:DUF998 domain-containing protein [Candidatus Micrarchaeota archaeon]